MKPFRFTLQSVRTIRQRREQEALEAYARALLARAHAIEHLQGAERALNAAQAEWQRSAQEGCAAAEMAWRSAHCRSLARIRDERSNLLAEAERQANAALKTMLIARQQREAVDKFLAKQRRSYERALTREEQKFLDELAQRRAETGLAEIFNEKAIC